MEQSYISKNLEQIIGNEDFPDPLDKVMSCIWLASQFKGIDLKILDTKAVSSLGDYFALISVDNPTAALGLSDVILEYMKKHGQKLISREGNKDSDWILMDYGDYVIHIFLTTARFRYDLDTLWKDAPVVKIPESYYLHQSSEEVVSISDSGDEVDKYI